MAEYLSSREDSVQLIKEVANIAEVIGEHVNLKRAGTNLKGLCPFHSEKTPSFIVNPDRRTYHCFGCGEGGDVFSFMMNYHRITFPEALKELAGKYNIVLDEASLSPQEREKAQRREKLFQVNEQAAEVYHDLLLNSPQADKARRYLDERGIPEQTVRDFKLGYAPESWDFFCRACGSLRIPLTDALDAGLLVARSNKGGHYDRFRDRILFPISNLTGKTVGFGGRILGDGQPKYLNSPESPVFDKGGILFGLYQNKEKIRKERSCILVEGNFDLLSLVVHGVNNTAAPLGTALTLAHIRSLKGYADKVILLFDGDQAGLKAALRAVPLFLTEQLPAEIVILPDSHDPDSFIRAHGKGELTELIGRARSLPEFVFEALVAQYGLTLEGKGKIIQNLRPIIGLIDDRNLQRTLFVSHFSKKLDLSPRQLQEGIPARVPPVKAEEKQECRRKANPVLPMKQRQLLEFLIIYPEYLQDFFNAGLEDFIVEPFARELLDLLAANAGTGDHSGNPEKLLETAQGDTRSFVSRVLISAPIFAEEVKGEIAAEWITWLKKSRMKMKNNSLIQLIGKAHQNNNDQLCMDLMEQKKQLDEGLMS